MEAPLVGSELNQLSKQIQGHHSNRTQQNVACWKVLGNLDMGKSSWGDAGRLISLQADLGPTPCAPGRLDHISPGRATGPRTWSLSTGHVARVQYGCRKRTPAMAGLRLVSLTQGDKGILQKATPMSSSRGIETWSTPQATSRFESNDPCVYPLLSNYAINLLGRQPAY